MWRTLRQCASNRKQGIANMTASTQPDTVGHRPGRREHPGHGDDRPGHPIQIILNARPVLVPDDTVTYEQILKLLPDYDPNYLYRVTYEKAAGPHTSGTLVAGQTVKVRKGTIFHATPTDKS
jgi:hypothetical protein